MRDEFTEDVKRVLASRVGNLCSNPDCGARTSGPQIDPAKALNVGVAAHITSASAGGPRYDSSLSAEVRKSATNGIWLCQTCGKIVDNDEARFPVDILRAWKKQAEHSALELVGKTGTPVRQRIFTAQLPRVHPTLIGREAELAFLEAAWANPATNFVQIFAAGGIGKTALVDKWFRRHTRDATIFAWSFYSQGMSESRQTSSELFFNEICSWLAINVQQFDSIYAKVTAIAQRMRDERILLILDGIEPLQNVKGYLVDFPLNALLQELETSSRGLVICTSRFRLDIPDDAPRTASIDLGNLTPMQGAEYLRCLELKGPDDELQRASMEYGNNALALTLLGTYLVEFCGGEISGRFEVRGKLIDDGRHGSHARRMMVAYEDVFRGTPEEEILRALSYFDHAAEPATVRLIFPTIGDHSYRAALNHLQRARLILPAEPGQPIDCHPLIREHFADVERRTAPTRFRERHMRLYQHYRQQQGDPPTTLDQVTPLADAVYHGCQAGLPGVCLREIYQVKLLRQDGAYLAGPRADEGYLTRHLGAFGTDISLLANFFTGIWAVPMSELSQTEQMFVTARAASSLRALGHLVDALPLMRVAADFAASLQDWKNAAVSYGNLSQLLLTMGMIHEAIEAAHESVKYADLSNEPYEQSARRTKLAEALHQQGQREGAALLFEEAERIIKSLNDPTRPLLDAVLGYRYCDFLLDEGRNEEVIRRALVTLHLAEQGRRKLNIGLNHLSLGRAYPAKSEESRHHLNKAYEYLRNSYLFMLPPALLARGTAQDLEQTYRIAARCGMKLYLTDYHLIFGRRSLTTGDTNCAEEHLRAAGQLINETGYHRRDRELQALRSSIVPQT